MTKLISTTEIQEEIDFCVDSWGPNYWRDPVKRRVLEALGQCFDHVDAIEEAALIKARADGQKAVRAGIGELLRDMHSGKALGINVGEDAPDTLRKTGAI